MNKSRVNKSLILLNLFWFYFFLNKLLLALFLTLFYGLANVQIQKCVRVCVLYLFPYFLLFSSETIEAVANWQAKENYCRYKKLCSKVFKWLRGLFYIKGQLDLIDNKNAIHDHEMKTKEVMCIFIKCLVCQHPCKIPSEKATSVPRVPAFLILEKGVYFHE